MKTKNTYFYIVAGVFFGFLYSLIPMYVNVILVQKIIEYVTDLRLEELIRLCFFSAIAIIIAELLNSVHENKIKPELKVKIRSDVMDHYLRLLESMDLKAMNVKENYENLKLIENKSFEQRTEFMDNLTGAILQISVLMSLIAFLMTQNVLVTAGVMIYAVAINLAGKKLNRKKFNFQAKVQPLLTEKEILTNYYLLPEYSEYIRDDDINRQAIRNFEDVCSDTVRENKNFLKQIFVSNTLYSGSSSAFMEYASLLVLGYLKMKKNMISTAQFLAYYRATDILVNGMDFLGNSINKLHFNYLFLKNERIQIKEEKNVLVTDLETLELQKVCLVIESRSILRDVCLKVKKGDKIAVTGRNASGKTTMLKILADMIRPSSGAIVLNGQYNCSDQSCSGRWSACYIPADTVFFVWENLDDGFFEKFVLNSIYDDAVSIVKGVKEFLGHSMLSEGEKKVLMIMRAFSSDCSLIVLDEPFANLDGRWKSDMEELIYRSGRTVVFSTHDTSNLGRCAKVYEMKR